MTVKRGSANETRGFALYLAMANNGGRYKRKIVAEIFETREGSSRARRPIDLLAFTQIIGDCCIARQKLLN